MVSCYWNSGPDGRLSCREVLYIYNADETYRSEMLHQDGRLFLRLSASLFADNCLLNTSLAEDTLFFNFWSMKIKGKKGKGRKKKKDSKSLFGFFFQTEYLTECDKERAV